MSARRKTGAKPKPRSKSKPEPNTSAIERAYERFLDLRRRAAIRMEPATPVSSEQVAKWEATHGISLPSDFRAFLVRFGDGAPCFPATVGGAKTRRLDAILSLSKRALDDARKPVVVDAKGLLPEPLSHGYTLEFCPFLTVRANRSSVSKRFDAKTVANGMLPLGRVDDGSLYYLALNGKPAGTIFVLSLGNDYEGMFATGLTFSELLESYIDWATPQLAKLVTVATAIQESGEAIWKGKQKHSVVMAELRRMLKGADDALAARLLEISAQCPSMRGRSGHLDFEVGQQLVYAMSHCVEQGRTELLRQLLRGFLAAPERSKLHPVVTDLALFVLLDDVAKGDPTLDFAKAFSLVDGEPELNRTEDECRRALLALSETAQARVLQYLPFPVLGALVSQTLLVRHGERVRASLAECLHRARSKPTLNATAAVYELARFLSNALRFPKDGHTRESLAKAALPLLPLLENAASVLPRNEKQYADLPETLEKLVAEVRVAARVPPPTT